MGCWKVCCPRWCRQVQEAVANRRQAMVESLPDLETLEMDGPLDEEGRYGGNGAPRATLEVSDPVPNPDQHDQQSNTVSGNPRPTFPPPQPPPPHTPVDR